jgi:hypothetical protein
MLAMIVNLLSVAMIALALCGSFALALSIEKLVRGRLFQFMHLQAQNHQQQARS